VTSPMEIPTAALTEVCDAHSGTSVRFGRPACGASWLPLDTENVLSDGLRMIAERLETQVKALESQVIQAVRSVGRVHDVVDSVEALVANLEARSLGATTLEATRPLGRFETYTGAAFAATKPPDRFEVPHGALASSAASEPGSNKIAAQRTLEEESTTLARAEGRVSELLRWQSEVEGAVRQLVADASRAGLGQASSDAGDRAQQNGHVEHRVSELWRRTASTMGQLEDDLLLLQRELVEVGGRPSASASVSLQRAAEAMTPTPGAAAAAVAAAATTTAAATPCAHELLKDSRPSVTRLYDELMRVETKSKAKSQRRASSSATSGGSCTAVRASTRIRTHSNTGLASQAHPCCCQRPPSPGPPRSPSSTCSRRSASSRVRQR